MADNIAGVLAILGALLVLLAGVGVLRFGDVYGRMHAATKATALGIAVIGVAGAVGVSGGWMKITIAVAFIFITAPSAAHLLARVSYRAAGIDLDLDGRDDLGTMLDDPES